MGNSAVVAAVQVVVIVDLRVHANLRRLFCSLCFGKDTAALIMPLIQPKGSTIEVQILEDLCLGDTSQLLKRILLILPLKN